MKKEVIRHKDIAQIRLFQALVYECIQKHLEPNTMSRIMNMMIHDYTWLENYTIQNIDIQDVEFMKLQPDERLKNISKTVKRQEAMVRTQTTCVWNWMSQKSNGKRRGA